MWSQPLAHGAGLPHDLLGRQTADEVTSVGSGVDDGVRKIVRSYEVRGLLERVTSYDGQNQAVNEVQMTYNGFGQLVEEDQAHGGQVGPSTPSVRYGYTAGQGNHSRLTQITYPNDRVLNFYYSAGADDNLSRVSYLHDSDGTRLAEYTRLGLESILRVDCQNGAFRFDLSHLTSGQYEQIDAFGRVVDLAWKKNSDDSDLARIRHGYDRAGNRLWRQDAKASASGQYLDELYGYDGVNQLVSLDRGQLNVGQSGIVAGTTSWREAWSLDATGNWRGYQQDTDASLPWQLDQSRRHNQANEVVGMSAWSVPVHDRAGNMTSVPDPDELQSALWCKYDAWNRLVEVREGAETGALVARYSYDGLGRRAVKEVFGASGSSSSSSSGETPSEIRHFYLSQDNQVLEERLGSFTTAERQYVWGLRYVDDCVLRDLGNERLYVLQDPNWNVAAIVGYRDAAWTVQERYTYAAYGKVERRDDLSFAPRASSLFDWTVLYTGRELDMETGLQYNRARYYDAELGSFVSRDPIGYRGGDANVFRYVRGRPLTRTDPSGNSGSMFVLCNAPAKPECQTIHMPAALRFKPNSLGEPTPECVQMVRGVTLIVLYDTVPRLGKNKPEPTCYGYIDNSCSSKQAPKKGQSYHCSLEWKKDPKVPGRTHEARCMLFT